jgi:DNA-binding transcriptional LysR family regulator
MKTLRHTLPALTSAVQTADSGSFTAAARVLNLTSAAVSKNVALLERRLGVRLFNRTTRRLSLTEEGKSFIAQVKHGLAALESATVSATAGLAPSGTVRVNCSVGFGRRYLLPQLPAFFARYPNVQIDLVLNDTAVDLVGEGFDIGIRGGSSPPEGMVARKICDVPSVLVATPRYLKKHGTPTQPSDLLNHNLLRVKFLNGKMYPWAFKSSNLPSSNAAIGLEFNPRLLISDPEMILDAVLLDMGIARLGRHHAHHALLRGDIVEVLINQQIPAESSMAIFYPHRAGLAPRVKVLVEYLIEKFAQEPSLRLSSPASVGLQHHVPVAKSTPRAAKRSPALQNRRS